MAKVIQFPQGRTQQQPKQRQHLTRNETIKRIKAALRRRSGRTWSVTGGKGTGWGWITIEVLPRERTWIEERIPDAELPPSVDRFDMSMHERCYRWRQMTAEEKAAGEWGYMGPEDCAELARLLSLSRPVHHQGQDIPAGSGYYQEYVDRAEGREPSVYGKRYWD
jgi:hypothetical protein